MESTITTPAAETNPQQQAVQKRAEIWNLLVEASQKLPEFRAIAMRKISTLARGIEDVEHEFLKLCTLYESLEQIANGPVPAIEPTAPIEPGGNESD